MTAKKLLTRIVLTSQTDIKMKHLIDPIAESDNLRLPIWALCVVSENRTGGNVFVVGDVEDVECLLMFRNRELAELVEEQANLENKLNIDFFDSIVIKTSPTNYDSCRMKFGIYAGTNH